MKSAAAKFAAVGLVIITLEVILQLFSFLYPAMDAVLSAKKHLVYKINENKSVYNIIFMGDLSDMTYTGKLESKLRKAYPMINFHSIDMRAEYENSSQLSLDIIDMQLKDVDALIVATGKYDQINPMLIKRSLSSLERRCGISYTIINSHGFKCGFDIWNRSKLLKALKLVISILNPSVQEKKPNKEYYARLSKYSYIFSKLDQSSRLDYIERQYKEEGSYREYISMLYLCMGYDSEKVADYLISRDAFDRKELQSVMHELASCREYNVEELLKSQFKMLHKICSDASVNLIVMNYPYEKNQEETELNRSIESIAAEFELHFVKLSDIDNKLAEDKKKSASQIIAERLFNYMDRRNLIWGE